MLITEIGYFCLLLAFAFAILQIALPFWEWFKKKELQNLAPPLAIAQFIAIFCSFLGLMTGFYLNDFSLIYVAKHSNSLLPWYYKLSATWGGHEGSLLLWITILALWGAMIAVANRNLPSQLLAYILRVLSAIQLLMISMLLASSSPFTRSIVDGMLQLAVDGADLNPLLQDIALIIHPPLLYMGYVGMAVPFAFCMAFLWLGEIRSAWLQALRTWVLVAWGFLTLGIAVGSWWAYYELGWGGWWFWDAVENASLLPWLVCTALLHSLAISQKRGSFKAWTIMLAIFALALSLLGTFLVRSGVISSVHSFASDSARGLFILLILAVVVGSGLLLFAVRGWRLSVDSNHQLKSRETLLIFNNIILLIAILVVLLGTLYPIIADSLGWGQLSVGSPYFNAFFVPLTWLLLLIMGVGVVVHWREDKQKLLPLTLKIGLICVLLTAIIISVIKVNQPFNIGITLALCFWVLAWSVYEIKASKGKGFVKKLPMHLAHLGVLITAIGIAISTSESIEKDVALAVGETVIISDYQFTMTEIYDTQGANFDGITADIQVSNGKNNFHLFPEKRTYLVSQMPMTESAIHATLWRDVYVALGEPIGEKWAVRIYIKPFVRFIWLGAVLMALAVVMAVIKKRKGLKSY